MLSEHGQPGAMGYILKLNGGLLSEEDKLMIKYIEELERKERAINQFVKHLERRYNDCAPGEARMTYYSIIKELKVFLKNKNERRR